MSEGKYDRSERKDSSKRESLIEQVRNFCMSSQLEEEFEQFARDNQDVFMSSLEMKENEEHPLAFHEVYQKYLQKFERSIENFIESTGYTMGEFYTECQDILETEELFSANRFFIETMLATSEYENFFMLMRGEMRTLRK